MFKKILIASLLLIVTAAVVMSVYYAVLARPARAAEDNAGPNLAQAAPALANPAGSAFSGSYGQSGGGRGGGNGGNGGSSGNGGGYRGGRGNAQGAGQGGGQTLPPASDLSAAEAQGLLYMIEEEKLARDVYQALYQRWNLPEFQNISQSEQSHMNAIQQLLDRYSLSSPLQGAGVFTDPALQSLYTELFARGSQSLAEAIQAGGMIEETDILDLQSRLAQTDNADIQQVYNNLLNGSANHLRSFANTLSIRTGATYQPQVLATDAYQTILSGSQGAGVGGGNGRGQGGNGQGGNGQGGNGRGQGGGGRGNGRGQGQGSA